jgi:RecJ-like exonuclease
MDNHNEEQDKDFHANLDTPPEETTQEASDTDTVEEPEVNPELNCPNCKGEGLLNQNTICERCLGTGRV